MKAITVICLGLLASSSPLFAAGKAGEPIFLEARSIQVFQTWKTNTNGSSWCGDRYDKHFGIVVNYRGQIPYYLNSKNFGTESECKARAAEFREMVLRAQNNHIKLIYNDEGILESYSIDRTNEHLKYGATQLTGEVNCEFQRAVPFTPTEPVNMELHGCSPTTSLQFVTCRQGKSWTFATQVVCRGQQSATDCYHATETARENSEAEEVSQ